MTTESEHDNWLDALRDDIKALGGTKVVGVVLWPEKDPEASGRRLNDMLNENKRDRLARDQERLIIRMAREQRGFSSALNYLCDETGFERPKPRDPLDEHTRLQREASRLMEEHALLTERMESLRKEKPTDPTASTKLHSVK